MAFVEEVAEHINKATWLLQSVQGPKVAAVLKELTVVQDLLIQRVKLIKIADRLYYTLGPGVSNPAYPPPFSPALYTLTNTRL